MGSLKYRILLRVSTFLLIGAMAGCGPKDDSTGDDDSTHLFHRSVVITKNYTDSIRSAKDSTTVLRLFKELDDSLTRINYAYPADTFIEMNEGQNDTLSNMLTRVVTLKDSILYRLAHPLVLKDTIAAVPDTTGQ